VNAGSAAALVSQLEDDYFLFEAVRVSHSVAVYGEPSHAIFTVGTWDIYEQPVQPFGPLVDTTKCCLVAPLAV
jgi:hypothetical protein